MHLIYGQPLHPVEPPPRFRTVELPPAPQAAQSARDKPAASSNKQPSQPVAGPSTRPENATNGVPVQAGSSKRPASPPLAAGPPKKKVKESHQVNTPACAVCDQRPSHLLKSCPVVMQGSSRFVRRLHRGVFDVDECDRIANEIRRLEKDSKISQSTLETLRKLQIRYQQREELSHSGKANP